MRKILLLFFLSIPVFIWAQNLPPVAMPDTMEIFSQDTVSMNVLLNDYDPEGNDFEINHIYQPIHGDRWRYDSVVYYVSEYYYGMDSMQYRIKEVNNPDNISEWAYIYVNVLENPDVPYAVNDTFSIKFLEPRTFDILVNDFDPNADDLKIKQIDFDEFDLNVDLSPDSSFVTVTAFYSNWDQTAIYYENIEIATPDSYYSNEAKVFMFLEENPELPVTVNDTFATTGGIPLVLDVLENDINPTGDTLEIYWYTNPSHASIGLEDDQFLFTAETSYVGATSFKYKIRYKNKPEHYSEEAEVYITVESNPDRPYGEADYGGGMAYTDIILNVLSNDTDPNADEIEIKDVYNPSSPMSTISFSGDTVIYRPQPGQIGPETARYRIQKVDAPEYYSEWIPITYDVEWNPGYPKTFPDSAVTSGGIDILVDFRSNDYIPDSLNISYVHFVSGTGMGLTQNYSDSLMLYRPFSRSSGRDTIIYRLTNLHDPPYFYSEGIIYIDVINNHSYDSLNINNINAGFNASGLQFSRIDEIFNYGIYEYVPHFEAPRGSGKHLMYLNTLWLGGISQSDYLHIAAERYRQSGVDWQPGPVYTGGYDSVFFKKWNRIWKLNLWEVNYHINNWWKEGYEPIETIASWPGNGDEGMAEQLAPYFDWNEDGIYDPYDGDYPLIRGEQCLYFITNDLKYHGETQSLPLEAEVHAMAYAYDAPNDSLLDNTVFIHYDLINRSENTYSDTYFGFYTDFHIGYAYDDRMGCHVMGNSMYAYNGEVIDGDGGPGEYGEYPPAVSHTVLAGPYIDPDNEDNPAGGCDESLLGLNFGNGIEDDERMGLSYHIRFPGGGGSLGEPSIGQEFYQFLQAVWKDQSPMEYGGFGHHSTNTVGPESRYLFPGDSDPYNWGTDCALPNGGYTQNGKWWTEEEQDIWPYDKNGLGSCGPFTFKPGDVQEVDVAFVVANSHYSADSSKSLLEARLMDLRQRVLDGEIVIPNSELDINEGQPEKVSFEIYPNPAAAIIHLQIPEELQNSEYFITNTMGTCVQSGRLSTEINIAGLKPGFYIISIKTERGRLSKKFIKY